MTSKPMFFCSISRKYCRSAGWALVTTLLCFTLTPLLAAPPDAANAVKDGAQPNVAKDSEQPNVPNVVMDAGQPNHWVDRVYVSKKGTPATAGINDTITLTIVNLDKWIKALKTNPDLATLQREQRSEWQLVLFLAGMPLPGINPESVSGPFDSTTTGNVPVTVTDVRFRLQRTAETKQVWDELQNRPTFLRPTDVSVGFLDLHKPIPTSVTEDKFNLVVMQKFYLWIGVGILIAAVAEFFYLAARNDILRDMSATPRPDGWQPFSLGRCQMAFWFFLVIGSYFFLWMITDAKDTVTASVLGLIGISAGTALGAALADASKRDSLAEPPAPVAKITTGVERKQEQQSLKRDIANADVEVKRLEGLVYAKEAPENLADLQGKLNDARLKMQSLQKRLKFFNATPFTRFMSDILGEDGSISFHHFQIAVWTLVLGIIFISDVYTKLTMPEFNATLLGLMGISSATYVGFKFPKGSS